MNKMQEKELEELALEERREYFRRWRAENKEKVQQHNKNYWAKRAMKKLEAKEPSTNCKGGDSDATNSDVGSSC